MKKIKKLLAMIMAMTMVLGMAMTVSAAPASIIIDIDGAGTGATFDYVQIIEPSTETETGWAFTSPDVATTYRAAFGVSSDQEVIWMLIGNADSLVDLPDGVNAATDSQIATALKNVMNSEYIDDLLASGKKGVPASEVKAEDAGIYYIMGHESGFTYNPMAAYVSFQYSDGVIDKLECAGVSAKKVPDGGETTKSADQENAVTEIGRTVKYTVGPSTIPYVYGDESGMQYWVYDTITGASYVTAGDENTISVDVYVGGSPTAQPFLGTITKNPDGTESFAVDLSRLLANNANANKTITIEYEAVVTDVYVGNDVTLGDATDENRFASGSEDLYTATIKLVKYASDDDNEDVSDNEKLSGAVFKVYKYDTDGATRLYAQADDSGKLVKWISEKADETELDKISTFTTDTNGEISLSGLGEGNYFFKEVTAPDGYSVNEMDKEISVSIDKDADSTIERSVNFFNDTLASLPSTGGIGTTIFTIGGCAIMIAAAALYFVNRRKSEEN